jgi:lipopolysaccharide export LptBFGC system permease protein LptF
MTLLGVPLALAFGRRSALAALCAAVGVGLTFWGASSGFQQLGNYGLLSARIAVWSPIVIFAAIGVYLLFRART